MARGIDHIVHAVRDLDAAAALYRRLGFTVGMPNRHPAAWGTENHIIQLPETFIELLTVVAPEGIAPHAPRHFSFGAFNRDFLSRGQGLSMLVLKGQGEPDVEEFRSKGIGDFALYEFEREGKRPDGTPLAVSFELAFATDPGAPDAGFFTCKHRRPENFWNPELQRHSNGASPVTGVVLVADDPERHRHFMEGFAVGDVVRNTDVFTIAADRQAIDMMTPAGFTWRFGVAAPDTSRGARLAAIRFSGTENAVVPAADAMGAVLIFEAPG
jgi:catechol 2,3-dioxygenase-like lactoylglutathione lyase family enzyme